MAQNRLLLPGLDELRDALRSMPADLTGDAAEFVDDATERAAASLVQSYPLGDSGNLRAGVKKTVTKDRVAVVGMVRSTSPHAHLWEFGTQNRQTRQGWQRGRSPSHLPDGLIPIAQRERRRLHAELVGLLQRAGFEVTGGV